MKILFDHPFPFLLAHGGVQVQIEQTKAALEQAGLEVEFLRWWDGRQTGDLVHFFGCARTEYLLQARVRRLPVVMTALFSEACNRPAWRQAVQGLAVRGLLALPGGGGIKRQLSWTAYRACDRLVVGLEAEKDVLVRAFGVAAGKVSVLPLGVSEAFLQAGPGGRAGDYLICTGTITRVKGQLELARLARQAEVPILFVGRPFHPDDPYWREFQSLVDGRWVRYQPHVDTSQDLIALLQAARGFVLHSQYENWSLAASEAVACGLPLLLPDLRWSRERFGDRSWYFGRATAGNVAMLRRFHREAPQLSAPGVTLHPWSEVGRQLAAVYTEALKSSR